MAPKMTIYNDFSAAGGRCFHRGVGVTGRAFETRLRPRGAPSIFAVFLLHGGSEMLELGGGWPGIPLVALLAAVAGSGCAALPVIATVQGVPNPVLLGPVTRIGGMPEHAAQVPDKALFTETVDSRKVVSGSGWRLTRDGTNKLSVAVLRATQLNPGRDVRLDKVQVGSFVAYPLLLSISDNWVTLFGQVQWVAYPPPPPQGRPLPPPRPPLPQPQAPLAPVVEP